MLPISWPAYLFKVSILIFFLAGLHYLFLNRIFKGSNRKLILWTPVLSFILPWFRLKLDFSNVDGIPMLSLMPWLNRVDSWGMVLQNAFDSPLISHHLNVGESIMIIYQIGVVFCLFTIFQNMSKWSRKSTLVKRDRLAFDVLVALAWFHPAVYYLRNQSARNISDSGKFNGRAALPYLGSIILLSLLLSAPMIIHNGSEFEISFKPFEKLNSLRTHGLLVDSNVPSEYQMTWGDYHFPLQYYANSDQINGSGFIDIGALRNIIRDPISFIIDGEDLTNESLRNLSIRFDIKSSTIRDSIQQMRRNDFRDYHSISEVKRDSLNRAFRRLLGRNWSTIDALPFVLSEDGIRSIENISEGDNLIISGSLKEASTVYLSLTVTNQVLAGNQQHPHAVIHWGEIAGFYDPGSRLCIIKCTLDDFQTTFRKPVIYRNLDGESQLISEFSVVNFDNKSRLDPGFNQMEENHFYNQMQSGDYLLVRFTENEESEVFYVDLGEKRMKTMPQPRVVVTWGDFEFSRFNHLKMPISESSRILDQPIIISDLDQKYHVHQFEKIRLILGRWDEQSCTQDEEHPCSFSLFREDIEAGTRMIISGLTTDQHKLDVTVDFQ